MSDTKEVSPWECMEGVRNYGPLYMSWFGAVRIEKKPLKYVEQFRLSQLHSHSAAPGATNVVRADPAEVNRFHTSSPTCTYDLGRQMRICT